MAFYAAVCLFYSASLPIHHHTCNLLPCLAEVRTPFDHTFVTLCPLDTS